MDLIQFVIKPLKIESFFLTYICQGGTVHMLCRNQARGDAACEEIKEKTQNENIHLHIVDTSRPFEIINFVENFKSQNASLHVLVFQI